MNDKRHNTRDVFSPTGSEITAKSWQTEAPMRMLMNNLHPDVAENPHELVVYGGIGRAARTWQDFDRIVASLKELEGDETLLVQSGKPVGVFKTHSNAPRVLIANSNLVPHWANWDHFNDLDKKGLAMYGQMTAGSWIYIGTQGIVQGTYETFAEAGRQHYGGDHIIYCGDYVTPEHPYLSMTKDELEDLFTSVLQRFNPAFKRDWVRRSWLYRAKYAQPVPVVNHSKNIPDLRTPLPGLYLASMSQVYPWDRGTNFAVEIGRRTARLMLEDMDQAPH